MHAPVITWRRLGTGAAVIAIGLLGTRAVQPLRAAEVTGPGDKAHEVTITATDFAFDGPDTLPAGLTTIHFVNRGPQLHHVSLMRLDAGRTAKDVMKALRGGQPLAWVHDAGGPNAVMPGRDGNATLVLQPGRYVAVCWIPGPDGVPHVMKGMMKELVVTASRGGADLPAADVTVTLSDYAFVPSAPLTAGHHVVLVRNTAAQSHELVLVKLAPGKTAGDFAAWVEKPEGAPAGELLGGISGIAPGAENTFSADLAPGTYAFVCFLPDAKDGKPHVAHGMMSQFDVR